MSRHISSRVQDAEWEVMWLKSLLGRRVFVPLFFPLKSINLFPYSLTANNSVSAFLVCQFVLFPMSLLSCSLFKIAYPMFPRKKKLLVGLRKVRRLISRTYMYMHTGGYSAGAGSSLPWVICERSVLLVGKNCSKNSNYQADSVYVVWDSCCRFTHTYTWKRTF